jgi:prepilin-type N-terminal cleavage/methylation domain-containing protein
MFDSEKLQALKQDQKKGFTLVELIVVIVILAILAAVAVPALTGYIDKARNQGLIADARNLMVAAQTVIVMEHANPSPTSRLGFGFGDTSFPSDSKHIEISSSSDLGLELYDEMIQLTGMPYLEDVYCRIVCDKSDSIIAMFYCTDFDNLTGAFYNMVFDGNEFSYQSGAGWSVGSLIS